MSGASTLVRAKRERCRLDARALADVAQGIASGAWCDAQVGAFAMAVAWRGMAEDECRDFTLALRDSGRTLRWDLDGPVLDKHSTGGVGDGVSLVLAPLVAACGGYVPMISGRGLGHTGGTLDKLESLPGYTVACDESRLRRAIDAAGCAIVGQSDSIVPADRRLYSIRDITATVDVPDLIVASILSKKLAAGADALVLDLKVGTGAQTRDGEAARALAGRMLAVGRGSGLALAVAFSDMDQVLGRCVGNALELRAATELLAGTGGDARLRALTLELASELLVAGSLATDRASARERLERALASGAAAERFERMVRALGGPPGCVAHPEHWFPTAEVHHPVEAARAGVVQVRDARAIGEAVVALGGGR
ncbi:MAG TPA: thymidine phosphorylase, partial [Xanthomonadales bacterium]|nr:thymidine phosphorylase [Xanthomonadales bacterium]